MNDTTEPKFASVVAEAALAAMTPEKVMEKVSKQADKLIEDAIREAMSSYGPVGKSIKTAVEESLKVGKLVPASELDALSDAPKENSDG